MRSLAEILTSVVLAADPQAATLVGDPAPPTVAAFLAEDSRSYGYDTFGPDGRLVFRVTFTVVASEPYGRLASERVWEARRVRFLPETARAVYRTTSLECPGFLHILERLGGLGLGRFDIPGITEAPLTMRPTSYDGYTYRFHGWGTGPADARTRLAIEGSAGVVGDLGQAADFQFKDCWKPEPVG